jgi:competence protein ComEA
MDPIEVEPERPAPPRPWPELFAAVVGDRRRLAVVAAASLAVVVAAIVVGAVLLRSPSPPVELSLPYPTDDATASAAAAPTSSPASTVPAELVVHAAGAVVVPGVHRVPAGSRVADVLAAAGGPAPDADVDAVNLAAPVADGDRIWFPHQGDVPPGQAFGPQSPRSGSSGPAGPAEPLDLNAATAEELDELPGVGPAIAAAIVEHRERDGPFRSVDDLLDVPGIGDTRLAQLRDLVRV